MFNPLDYPIAYMKPRRTSEALAWLDNIPFAFALVQAHRPKLIVELGTHTGVSYFAFCQAVEVSGLPTKCYGIDTWEGDEHAGFYGEEIFRDLVANHEPLYSNFSKLLRMKFDDALKEFRDGYIDLLHIDGCHEYESVKHDFESWRPKLSSRSVVLLHDINAQEPHFGARRFFVELQSGYPVFEFTHGYGLGVVAVGEETRKEPIWSLFEAGTAEVAVIRRFFSSLGNEIQNERIMQQRDARIRDLEAQLAQTNAQLAEANAQIVSMLRSRSWWLTSPLRWIYRHIFERADL